MPPKKGIVKSGNFGNSSKATKTEPRSVITASGGDEEKKPLFAPGYKWPLSLLQERCQKSGWEKPTVDTRKLAGGYCFVVTLKRMDKKTSQLESVRLEPHPPFCMPSAIEARHWGATYALYRFCNGIQLNRVLPPGPREYWNQLAIEHKTVAEHQQWMYDADPFAARKVVDARQAAAASKKEKTASANDSDSRSGSASHEFSSAPEVRMASELREAAEEAIKQAFSSYPEAEAAMPLAITEEGSPALLQQLGNLGFRLAQARSAVEYLSQPSSLTRTLLQSLSPLEACIEYLILHVPECDLPRRFLPSKNSSNPIVTSTHSGAEDLKKRWMEDRAVKQAGWPLRAVKQCLSNDSVMGDWSLLTAALNRMLIGQDWDSLSEYQRNVTFQSSGEEALNSDDLEGIGAFFVDDSEMVLPLNTGDFKLHLLVAKDRPAISAGHPPPMYLTSPSISAYIRLHLLAQLLRSINCGSITESGTGFLIEAMGHLQDAWEAVEEHGPPDISEVMQYLLPKPPVIANLQSEDDGNDKAGAGRRGGRLNRQQRRDPRGDDAVRRDFDNICKEARYRTLLEGRRRLPSFSARETFLDMLSGSRVVVVVGETGCGKTTQLPQFILDSLILANNGAQASIIVTQPRRLSAISVAARVSAERLDDGSVGYAIRGESKQGPTTKLLFCTTGVVLRRLGSGDTLKDVTHVIVDEVHERSVDGDFLLLELKELLSSHPTLKVVLMSATINHETFIKYFDGAPLLTIPGFAHPVEDIYLEGVMPLLTYRPPAAKTTKKQSEEEKRALQEEYTTQGLDKDSLNAIQNIIRSDRLDYQLIAAVVKHIVTTAPKRGGVLIFLPGVQEIRQCIDAVRSNVGRDQADVYPLHANLSSDEQRVVFLSTTKWKIIAATNVAETSITIDDVIYVVDCGKVKETQYDAENGLSRLSEIWITRAAGRQRRGRAGRTQPGVCYKLYTRRQENNFAKYPIPEILRVPLESILLAVKVARAEEDAKSFLSRAIDPPTLNAMDSALSVLEELGAIDEDGILTALGRHMSLLPVDLRLAKMMILGSIFQCLDPILTVAACLSSKPLFISPMDKRDEAAEARARFATGNSDLLTDAKAYEEVMRLRSGGKPQSSLRTFCETNFISSSTVRDISSLRQDFLSALSSTGFLPATVSPSLPVLNANRTHIPLLKAVILGGLWPRVARVVLPRNAIKFDRVSAGAVQRENTAKEFKMYDLRDGRVFLHPASVLFGASVWKAPFLVYFQKHMTSKVFLRDATEVPLFAILLFGGTVTVNHVAGGLTVKTKNALIKLKAWPRIGVLVNQLRRLLDIQLQRSIEEGTLLDMGRDNPVVQAMLSLLANDGLTGGLSL